MNSVLAQELGWPREVVLSSGTLTIYQPQVDKLDKDILNFRAAVSFKAKGSNTPVFGAAWFESRVEIDRAERRVDMLGLTVTDTRFPEDSVAVKAEFDKAIKEDLPGWDIAFSLDDLLTSLEASEEQIAAANDLKMDPPTIVYRDNPALLILLDGEPVLRKIENSPFEAVINTPYPLIVDTKKKTYYLNAAKDVWYQANRATGPYRYLPQAPSDIKSMVDPSEVEGSDEEINAANAPEIIVRTTPTELIVTDGQAEFEPLVDDLLVIGNSDSDVFMHVSTQKYYIVLSGRWYRASSMQGPWEYTKADALPPVFGEIPPDSKQAESRVYVAGTDEAREAVMDAQIPQTAAISKGRVNIEVSYDGEPRFDGIKGTGLAYAENTGSTVIRSAQQYFLVEDAVWYVSSSPKGPWEVAESRPEGVDSIPPESPVYNVKYVYIYETTPQVVYVGYTPGYTGSYVYNTTIVYGTGWYYRPWISPYYYYPRQATWGFSITYNPWTGWGFGLSWGRGPFRVGFYTGGSWHHSRPWYHGHSGRWGAGGYRPRPVHYRNTNINIGTININSPGISVRDRNLYRDKNQVARVRQTRDVPVNRDVQDRVAARGGKLDRSNVERNKPGNRAATSDSTALRTGASTLSRSSKQNNVFTDKQGNVYRNTGSGWQKREAGGWKNNAGASGAAGDYARRPADAASTRNPVSGSKRSSAYQSSRSGYNKPSSLDRQNYSRSRSSNRNQQHNQQRARKGAGRAARRR